MFFVHVTILQCTLAVKYDNAPGMIHSWHSALSIVSHLRLLVLFVIVAAYSSSSNQAVFFSRLYLASVCTQLQVWSWGSLHVLHPLSQWLLNCLGFWKWHKCWSSFQLRIGFSFNGSLVIHQCFNSFHIILKASFRPETYRHVGFCNRPFISIRAENSFF